MYLPDGELLGLLTPDHPASIFGGQEGDVEQVEGLLVVLAVLVGPACGLPLVDGEDVPEEDHLLRVGHRVPRVEVPQVGVGQHAPLLAVRRRLPLGL